MNFLHLEYFISVANELNITKAAACLNMSQQSLSRHILNLESKIGTSLFHRGAKLTLTEAGSCFLMYATKLLDLKCQAIRHTQDIHDFRFNHVKIGITHARSPIYLPFLLPKFRESFPEAQIFLTEKPSEELFNDLSDGEIDLIIGIEPQNKADFHSYTLCIEDYVVMIPNEIFNNHINSQDLDLLNSNPESSGMLIFKDCPFLCFDTTKRIGKIFKNICNNAGFQPNVVLESSNINTLINLCMKGLGIIICPTIFVEITKLQTNMLKSVKIHPIPNSPMQTNIAISLSQNRYASKLTREFILIAKEAFKEISHNTFTEHFIANYKNQSL